MSRMLVAAYPRSLNRALATSSICRRRAVMLAPNEQLLGKLAPAPTPRNRTGPRASEVQLEPDHPDAGAATVPPAAGQGVEQLEAAAGERVELVHPIWRELMAEEEGGILVVLQPTHSIAIEFCVP